MPAEREGGGDLVPWIRGRFTFASDYGPGLRGVDVPSPPSAADGDSDAALYASS